MAFYTLLNMIANMMEVKLKANKPTAMSIRYVAQKISISVIVRHKIPNGRAKSRPEIPDDFGFSFFSSLQTKFKQQYAYGHAENC